MYVKLNVIIEPNLKSKLTVVVLFVLMAKRIKYIHYVWEFPRMVNENWVLITIQLDYICKMNIPLQLKSNNLYNI